MAKDSKTQVFYIKLGAMKYAFRAKTDAYKGIQPKLGVLRAKDTDDNLSFGANSPKPARVRINLANGKSVIRFADPSRVEELIVKGSLNGKKYDGQNINSVSMVQG